ncbi:replication initiation protein [Larsenimonas suaedae]|uniref:Replication initiation protein n=1 Tax=Larsenimonas suaedae TaxID=1851019 RepID=A0ABU1GZ36_9GAMM|nr:replication initiation protein [Larsenimonas suaedae]MCM2973787.1 replication initiation protein [Larsenimonas suaedae]MDR5897311.1 replication initiation protein [Larsenimonas suaedae]
MSEEPKPSEQTPLLAKYKGTPRVSMSNALARSAHDLSLHEKRLVALCISKMDSRKTWTPERLVIRITVPEYRETFDIDHDKHVYRDLKEAAERLETRRIRFAEAGKKGERLHSIAWVGRATYAQGEGWVELAFWHELAPHLFKLRQQFTTYHLKQASALRSVYSWRLLELLMQFRDKQALLITLEDLHHALDVPDSLRKSFKDLRRRVLEPATKELKDKENLTVEFTPRKTGRRITSLKFDFGYEQQTVLDLE